MKDSVHKKSKIKKQTDLVPVKDRRHNDIRLDGKKTSFLAGKGLFMKRGSKQLLRKMLLSKTFHIIFKIFVVVLVSCMVFYGLYSYFNKSLNNDVVVSKSEIVDRVAKLATVPKEEPNEVVRVEDAEKLKQQNSFYNNVKVGDYIVMYSNMAIVYDLRNNVIVAMKKLDK